MVTRCSITSSAAAQSDPRREASCYCGYLWPADLAALSPAGSTPQSVLASVRSAAPADPAGCPAAACVHFAGPRVHAGAGFLLHSSCLYFTGFHDLWQVPCGPGQLQMNTKRQIIGIS